MAEGRGVSEGVMFEQMKKEANWVREQRNRKCCRGKLANVADLLF